MTVYTFKPDFTTYGFVQWTKPALWVGGVVPNASDADVVFPAAFTGTGAPFVNYVLIQGTSINTRSIELRDYLGIQQQLSISGALHIYDFGSVTLGGGTLTAGQIVNEGTSGLSGVVGVSGYGSITVGTLTNNSSIFGTSGFTLNVNATQVTNIGTLGNVTLTVGAGGITGFANGTLSAGTLYDGVRIDAGGLLTTNAASIILTNFGTIETRDPTSGNWVPFTQSLTTIAQAGSLTIAKASYQFQQLTIAGTVTLNEDSQSSPTTQLGATNLSITATGNVLGGGTITSAIQNDGVIRAGLLPPYARQPYLTTNLRADQLTIDGAITGTGHLEIAAGQLAASSTDTSYQFTLQLKAANAQDVVFKDRLGTLLIDQPSSFTGAIQTSGNGDRIVLSGVGLSSITNVSYVGTTSGGTLTLQTGSGSTSLHFSGDHKIGNFALAPGPFGLSTDPPSLAITVGSNAPTVQNDFNGDGRSDILWRHDGGSLSDWLAKANGGFVANDGNAATNVATSWHVVGTGDFNGDGRSDILWRNDNGGLSDWLGQANGGFVANDFNALDSISTSWHVVGTADFNGDGISDILWRTNSGLLFDWLGKTNGDFSPNDANLSVNVSTDWKVAGTGDFNGDGRDDVLWRSDSGLMSDWLGTATGGLVSNDANAFTSVTTSWKIAGTGDFNSDGFTDILWRSDSGQLSDWLGKANGGFVNNDANAFTSVSTSWHVVETGDYNGDGRDDILWRSDSGQLSNWLGRANGGFVGNDANAFTSVPTDWKTQPVHDFVL